MKKKMKKKQREKENKISFQMKRKTCLSNRKLKSPPCTTNSNYNFVIYLNSSLFVFFFLTKLFILFLTQRVIKSVLKRN